MSSKNRDLEALRLLRHLFERVFCVEQDIGDELRAQVLPAYFMGWLHANMPDWSAAEVCAAAGVEFATYEFVREIVEGGLGPERIKNVWWQVCMASRPPAQHKVKSVVWSLLLRYEDDAVSKVQVIADLPPGVEAMGDADLAGFLTENSARFVEAATGPGVDGLYAAGANYGGVEVFSMLMGAFVSIIPQLKEEYHARLRGAAQLATELVYPELVKAPSAQVAKMPESPYKKGAPRGGFGD